MDRKNCTHTVSEQCILLVAWCVRCSGWRVQRVGVDCGSSSDTASTQVYERHFLPAEETSPEELQALIQRTFRCAQEWEQDRWDYGASQMDFDLGPRS